MKKRLSSTHLSSERTCRADASDDAHSYSEAFVWLSNKEFIYLSGTVISPRAAFWLAEKIRRNVFKFHMWTFTFVEFFVFIHLNFILFFTFTSVVVVYICVSMCVCVCLYYRRTEVPGGGPGLEGISGGGDPMPISGSWVNRKPCKSHKCDSGIYLIIWILQYENKIHQ